MRARMGGVFSGVVTRKDVALLGLARVSISGAINAPEHHP